MNKKSQKTVHLQLSLVSETRRKLPEHVLCARPVKGAKWDTLGFPARARVGLFVGQDLGDLDSSTTHW